MPPRRFHFQDAKSDKFWEIEREAATVHVRYGRSGTAGQSKSWTFDAEAQAIREYDKRLAEKLREGYVEVAAETPRGAPASPAISDEAEKHELSLNVWRQALELAAVPREKITAPADGESALDWFTGQLWDYAPGAVQTDWRESIAQVCRQCGSVLRQFGIQTTVGEDDDDPLEVAVEGEGSVVRAKLAGVTRESANQAAYLFTLASMAPPSIRMYSLRGLEDSDSWGYLVLREEQWDGLRTLLGPQFSAAFAEHKPAKAKLTKTKSAPPGAPVKFLTRATIKKNLEQVATLVAEELKSLAEKTETDPAAQRHGAAPPGLTKEEWDRASLVWHLASRLQGRSFVMERALLAVFRGDRQGYAEVAGVARCGVWADRMLIRYRNFMCDRTQKERPAELGGQTWQDINSALMSVLCAISLRQDQDVEWMMERARNSLAKNPKNWSVTPFEEFAVRLHARWRGIECDAPAANGPDRQVYQALLDTWDDEAAFTRALHGICDYHCTHCRSGSDSDPVAAFYIPPFNFYPVEIHALARMRADLGLPMPTLDHPLLATPFGPLPPVIEQVVIDPVLERAVRRIQELDPGFPED